MRYSSFMDWIDETCRLIQDIEEIVIDPASEAFVDDCFDNRHMQRLCHSMTQRSCTVQSLTLRDMMVGPRGAAWLQHLLQNNPGGLRTLSLQDTKTGVHEMGEEHDRDYDVFNGEEESIVNDDNNRINSTTTTTTTDPWKSPLKDDDKSAMIRGIACGLESNRRLERLHLKGNQITDASCLGRMLSNNNTLLDLRLCYNRLTRKACRALCAGLKDNMALQILDLTGNHMDDKCIEYISRGLHHHATVSFLCLDFNAFGHAGVAAISNMLQNNSILRDLHLFGNSIDEEGGRLLAMGLSKNTCLSTLILSFNNLQDGGASHLAQALMHTSNTTLRKLWLPANHVANAGLRAFSTALPHMRGLQQLNIGDTFDNEAAFTMLTAMQQNMELRTLFMESVLFDNEDLEHRIDFHVRLNQAGRKNILGHSQDTTTATTATTIHGDDCGGGDGDDRGIPASLWSRVLHRADAHYNTSDSCPDVLYYLLREKPDLVCSSSSSSW